MAAKRKKMAENELERPPEERQKNQSIVKIPPPPPPPTDSPIAFELRNLKKVKTGETMATIPDDLVPNILLHLPGDVLYNVMRLVCKSWFNIINDPDFMNTHTYRSSSCTGFLSTVNYGRGKPAATYFLEIGYGKRNRRKVFDHKSSRGTIISSCDGIVLVRDFSKKGEEVYRILNPVTRQVVTHHTIPKPRYGARGIVSSGGIGYARSSRRYKVVCAYRTTLGPVPYNMSILTLGVDSSWRCIKKQQTNNIDAYRYYEYTLSIGDFLYWYGYQYAVVLALDMEEETIHQVRIPIDRHRIHELNCSTAFIKSEKFLVFVLCQGNAIYDFWALANPKTGEWEKLYRVNLYGKQERLSVCRLIDHHPCSKEYSCNYCFHPRLILNDGVVVFSVWEADVSIGYDVKTGALYHCGKSKDMYHGPLVVHRQTMVRLK